MVVYTKYINLFIIITTLFFTTNIGWSQGAGISMSGITTVPAQSSELMYQCQIYFKNAVKNEVIVHFSVNRNSGNLVELKKALVTLPNDRVYTKWKFWGRTKNYKGILYLTPQNSITIGDAPVQGIMLDLTNPEKNNRYRQITYLTDTDKPKPDEIKELKNTYVYCSKT